MDWNRSLLGRAVAATAVIASCVTFGAPPAASSDPGTGSISGTVLDDQGMPLGGVCVYAQNVTGTMTGPGGTYLIDNVPAGQHRVQFSDCNPAPTYLTQWYLGAADESTAALVNVADQANTALADVHMVPGVSVTGTVTDTANSPLQDIRVELQPQDPPNDYISGYTDSNGQYRTGPVKDGQYKVRFVDNRYPAQYAAEFWNDEYLEADAQSLDLRVANGTLVTGIDAQLGDGATIAGNVRDQDSSPLSQVCVNAMTPHPDDHHLAGANTDASGNYSISGLPPVSTVVSFHDCNSPATHADQWYDGVTDRDDAQHLSLSPGTTLNGIDAQMTLGATISGKVTGTGGAPAANICVQAVTGTDDDWNSVGWAQTDASGNYELERLPTGNPPCELRGLQRHRTVPGTVVQRQRQLRPRHHHRADSRPESNRRERPTAAGGTDHRHRDRHRRHPTGGNLRAGHDRQLRRWHGGDRIRRHLLDHSLAKRASTRCSSSTAAIRTPNHRSPGAPTWPSGGAEALNPLLPRPSRSPPARPSTASTRSSPPPEAPERSRGASPT
ncbi:MAG: carboxypeptidase regulatory-like domain-containing protein [Microthrixaceae bacterium]|nr:carboxypeptidase regulatory-like domain-containing protein [Microthrixaceae bacterium]